MFTNVRRRRLLLAALAGALLAALAGRYALAAYPGTNGRISYGRFDQAIGDFRLYTANPDGTHEAPLTTVPSENSRWSPAGDRIAYDFVDPAGNVQVATVDPAQPGAPTQLTTTGGFHGEPSWSPDGARIAFDSDQGDHPAGEGIYTMDSGTGGNLARLTANPYGVFDVQPSWSPDGQWIAFSRFRSITPQGPAQGRQRHRAITALYLVHPDGTGLRRLTPWGIDVVSPDWSPDGRWVAYSSAEEAPQPAQIWLVRPDGSGRHAITRVTGGGFVGFGHPAFSPDGTEILAEGRVDSNGDRQLWLMRSDGTGLQALPIGGPVSFPDWGTAPLQ